MKYYLGIDNGGTGTKAAVYSETGEELAVAAVSTEALIPKPGFAERDMEAMWRANCEVIRRAVDDSGISPRDIACVACCGHGKGLYLWGRDGRPAYRGILSTDNRAWEYPPRWVREGVQAQAFARSGQRVLASQPVALLAWLRDREPAVLANTRYVFACKDYIRFRLTGEAFAERSDASGSHLVNLHTGEYDPELLRLFGLEDLLDRLPPLRVATDLCGRITARAAADTGLAEGTPVAGGAFDIDACAVAVGALDESQLCMIAGTWSINEYVSPRPVLNGEMMNSLFCVPGLYLVEECSPTSAGNLAWFVRAMLPELKAECARSGESVYALADRWVESIPPEELCPIFLPFLLGSNDHPQAKGCLIGMQQAHGREQIVRAVFEGVAFSHRHHLERLLAAKRSPAAVIRLAGGAGNSAVWMQMFADAMKLPVETIAAGETGALGCAVIAAAAVAAYEDLAAAARAMSRVTMRLEPNPAHSAAYDHKYALYQEAVSLLRPLWDNMQAYSTRREA